MVLLVSLTVREEALEDDFVLEVHLSPADVGKPWLDGGFWLQMLRGVSPTRGTPHKFLELLVLLEFPELLLSLL